MNNRRLILNVIIIFIAPLFLLISGGKDLSSALAAEPPLIKAVKNYDYDLVEKLIKSGCDIKARSEKGMTPAHQALKIFRDGGGYVMYTWDSEFVLLESGEISVKMARLILENGGECVYADDSESKDSTLSLAAISGDAGLVSLLIKGGADVNYKGANSLTPLILAAMTASPEILKILCNAGADINAKLDSGENALTMAMMMKKHANALFLAKRGADANLPYFFSKQPPLEFAIKEGAPFELIEALVKGGANVNFTNPKNKRSILVCALDYCLSNDIIKSLVESGADINAASYSGKTPLIAASASIDNIENLKYLLSKGVNTGAKDDSGSSAIDIAEANGNQEAMTLLSKSGLKSDPANKNILNALLVKAAMDSDTGEIRALVAKGASACAGNQYGSPILYECVREGKIEAAMALIESGAEIFKELPGDCYDALVEAINRKNTALIHKMLDKIEIDKRSHTAEIYLKTAISVNSVATLSYLLSKGFDPDQRFILVSENKTEECPAAVYAAKYLIDPAAVLNMLLAAGADINARDSQGMSALMHAVKNDKTAGAEFMLKNGAAVNLKDNEGRGAADLAALNKNRAMMDLLIKHGAKYDYENAQANAEKFLMDIEGNNVKELAAVAGKKGAGADIIFKNGKTALIMAAEKCNFKMVKLLIEKGADVNLTLKGCPDDFYKNSLEYDMNKKKIEAMSYNALNAAVACKQCADKFKTIEFLLKSGAKIIPSVIRADTVIYFGDNENIFKLLVASGLDINTRFYEGETALMACCEYRFDSGTAGYLLKKGADVNICNDNGTSALMKAAKKGFYDERIAALIKAGANVNQVDKFGNTPLIYAFQDSNRPDKKLVQALVDAGAKIEHKNAEGFTAAYYAACNGADERLKELMEKGAAVDEFSDSAKISLLRYHIRKNETAEVERILSEGAKPDFMMGESGYARISALSYCIRERMNEIAKMLLDRSAGLKYGYGSGGDRDDALCEALAIKNYEIAGYIINRITIERVVKKNYIARFNGAAAIHHAALTGDIDMIKKIISAAGDINCLDENGRNALQLMCRETGNWQFNNYDGFGYLIDNGILIDNRDNKSGESAIFIAVEWGSETAAAELIKKGADISFKNNEGITPLIKAARCGHKGKIELLLKAGAKVDYNDKKHVDALLRYSILYSEPADVDFYIKKGLKLAANADEFYKNNFNTAISNNKVAAAEVFIKNGFKADFKGGMKELGVYDAARSGHLEAVKYFIDNGADINAPNGNAETLLISAAKYQCKALMLYLINAGADVKCVDDFGRSALLSLLDNITYVGSRSCIHDHVIINTDLIELLIKKGAEVNVKDKEGNTPFKMVNQALLRLKHGNNCKKCADMIKTIVKILKSAGAK